MRDNGKLADSLLFLGKIYEVRHTHTHIHIHDCEDVKSSNDYARNKCRREENSRTFESFKVNTSSRGEKDIYERIREKGRKIKLLRYG